MPTVPRRDPATVKRLEALPNVQFAPSGATEETFGGGPAMAKLGAASHGLAEVAMKLSFQEQENMDKAYAQSMDPLLVRMKNETKADINQNYQLSKAVEAPDRAYKYLDDTQKMIDQAPNDNIKNKLIKMRAVYANELDSYSQTFMAGENERWQKSIYESNLASKYQDSAVAATTDIKVVEKNNQEIELIVKDYADKFNIPQNSEVYKQLLIGAQTGNHVAVINSLIVGGDAVAAKEYFNAHKNTISPDKLKTLDDAIGREVVTSDAMNKAKEIQTLGEDPSAVNDAFMKIEDKALRRETQMAYEYLMKEQAIIYNNNESDISSRIAKGEITKPIQIQTSQTPTSLAFQRAAQLALSVKPSSIGTKKERKDAYIKLAIQFSNITDTDIYDKSKKYADFRTNVLASRGLLTQKEFNDLLQWTDPQYVQMQTSKKQPWFKSAFESLVKSYPWDVNFVAGSISRIMDKAKELPPEKMDEYTRSILREKAYSDNPVLMQQEEPSNYVYEGGNVKVAYPAKSDAKFTEKVEEDRVEVIKRSDGKKYSIPREKFDNKRYKLVA